MVSLLRFVERWARPLLAVYLLLLLAATHYPTDIIAYSGPMQPDKGLHLLAYCVLAFLIAMSLPRARSWQVVGLVVLIGVLDEVTQPYFNRMQDPFDLLADAVGAFAGYAIASWARRVEKPGAADAGLTAE